ncbi:hypothetical protein ACIOZL_17440 [Streptomyces sp. NPDC087769]|uniref:hypothetical protein n=1 Tax=Streptomyces sp. NPDC087769 TaxID=3365802 RepID=UPI00381929EF
MHNIPNSLVSITRFSPVPLPSPALLGILELAGPDRFRLGTFVRAALAGAVEFRRVLTDDRSPCFGAASTTVPSCSDLMRTSPAPTTASGSLSGLLNRRCAAGVTAGLDLCLLTSPGALDGPLPRGHDSRNSS